MDYEIVNIDFSDIPDKMFIEAVQVRDIVKARPLTRAEKSKIQRGGPDILITPVIGQKNLMYRTDVINCYTYTNGKKIKIKGWSSDNVYVLYRSINVKVAVMQVPLNNIVTVNNSAIANNGNKQSGDYIICLLNSDGSINRDSASVVTAATFRKMCYIPPCDIIKRHRGSHSKFFDFSHGSAMSTARDYNNKVVNQARRMSIPNRTSGNNININKTGNGGIGGIGGMGNTGTNGIQQPVQTKTSINKPTQSNMPNQSSRYKVVRQVHNGYGQRIGFVIMSETGAEKMITKDIAIKLCNNKKIINMELVKSGDGSIFLRGNGIKLDDLPIEYHDRMM